MRIKKFTFLLVIALLYFNAAAQITGSARTEYIDGHTKACDTTQSAAAMHAGVSRKIIRQYCKCSATYIADVLNNKLAVEIYEGRIKFNETWNEMAAKYCRIHFEKY